MELTPPPSGSGVEDADFSELQAHDEVHLDLNPHIYREKDASPFPYATKTDGLVSFVKGLFGNAASFVISIAVIVGFAAYIVIPHWVHPAPPAPTREDVLALDWVHHKAEYEAAFWKDHATMPIIAMVVAPDGATIVGRIKFMETCPAGNLCAEPDGRVIDTDGDDVLAAEADAVGAAAEADYERR